MDLDIPYTKVKGKDDAFQTLQQQLSSDILLSHKIKAELQYDDASKTIHANGKGFDLKVLCQDQKATVEMKLSFLLRPFKGKILTALEEEFIKIL